MPIMHFYECSKGHITEKYLPYESHSLKHPCSKLINNKKCRSLSSKVLLSPRKGQNALNFKPIEFYLNPKGEVINLGCSIRDIGNLPNKVQAKMRKYISKLEKKGFKHKEISNIQQYETFRRSHNEKLTLKNLEEALGLDLQMSEYLKSNIDDLKRGFTMTRSDGSEVSIPPLDKFDHPEVVKFAEDLMSNRNVDLSILDGFNSKLADEIRDVNNRNQSNDANFYIDSMENDSNRRAWI